jgi:large subunit ribosomal protein L9
MAANVQVILKQDVDKLGQAGQVVKVKPGFARNYLLPRSLAVLATGGNIKQVEHERRIALAAAEKARKIAQGEAAQIDGLTVEIAMQAGEEDKLYGSVTTRDIADALHSQGIELDRRRIELAEPIRNLGAYDIEVKLSANDKARFKLLVVKN